MNLFSVILVALTAICGLVYYFYQPLINKVGASKFLQKFLFELKTSFWILFFVLVFRSFLFEPFQVPTGSMIPTIKIGDFVLVNKFSYGLRLPITNTLVLPLGNVERGDVVVFYYPKDQSISYIKRAIGLPGDVVFYDGSNLSINDVKIDTSFVEENEDFMVYEELLANHPHLIQKEKKFHLNVHASWKIPEGKYFMMGDNRDNSSDSRFFGFVDEQLIQGRAVLVWMNWKDWATLPSFSDFRMIK